jgi:hypothetical protein
MILGSKSFAIYLELSTLRVAKFEAYLLHIQGSEDGATINVRHINPRT